MNKNTVIRAAAALCFVVGGIALAAAPAQADEVRTDGSITWQGPAADGPRASITWQLAAPLGAEDSITWQVSGPRGADDSITWQVPVPGPQAAEDSITWQRPAPAPVGGLPARLAGK